MKELGLDARARRVPAVGPDPAPRAGGQRQADHRRQDAEQRLHRRRAARVLGPTRASSSCSATRPRSRGRGRNWSRASRGLRRGEEPRPDPPLLRGARGRAADLRRPHGSLRGADRGPRARAARRSAGSSASSGSRRCSSTASSTTAATSPVSATGTRRSSPAQVQKAKPPPPRRRREPLRAICREVGLPRAPKSRSTAARSAGRPSSRRRRARAGRAARCQNDAASTAWGSSAPRRSSTASGTGCGSGGTIPSVIAPSRSASTVEPGRARARAQPGRLGADPQADQVGPVLREHREHLVDVARPRARARGRGGLLGRRAGGCRRRRRRRPVRVALDVDEVAQRELRQVHAVDEREADAAAAERRSGSARAKKSSLVSGTASPPGGGATLQVVGGVDADRRRAGEREAVAVADADLEVGRRLEQLVDVAQEVQVVHGGQYPSRVAGRVEIIQRRRLRGWRSGVRPRRARASREAGPSPRSSRPPPAGREFKEPRGRRPRHP